MLGKWLENQCIFFNVDFIMYINFYLEKLRKFSIFEKNVEERNMKIIQIKKFYADF